MAAQTIKIARTVREQNWRDHAVCLKRDPEIWFRKEDQGQAQAYCWVCPVQSECLKDAMAEPESEQWAVRGGFTPKDLRRMVRRGAAVVLLRSTGRAGVRVA